MAMVDTNDEYVRQEVFRNELLSDETIQWTGQPDPYVIFTKADIFLIPFSLMWGGFAVFWELAVLGFLFDSSKHGGPPIIFPLFGLPFVLVGIYFIIGRFFFKAWKQRHTFYAVTNKRILIAIGNAKSIQAVFIKSIPSISKSIGANRIGTVVFGISNSRWWDYANTGMEWMGSRYGPPPPSFYDIAGADSVYNIVNQLRDDSGEKRF